MIEASAVLGADVGIAQACRALGVPRSSVYRARQPKTKPEPRPSSPRALSAEEKAEIRAVLNSGRFCDHSPRQVYATLLDEDGVYLCHWRTMYRILKEHNEVHERRKQRRHPKRIKPELRATGPNQVWSWDITQLRGSGCFYYLYAIVDVFSRYLVGWLIGTRESGELAEKLIAETCAKQGIERDRLILHSDRGSAMRSKTVQDLLRDLGVEKSYSRPYTPTDNPFSEAQFKTMKYRPEYPGEFGGLIPAREWARAFVHWYNEEHHHTGLGLMTPVTVHYGRVEHVRQQRQATLDAAYEAHPERFVGGRPTPPALPEEVWINQPERAHENLSLSNDPATSERESGTQIETGDTTIFLPKFEQELCQ